MIDLYADPLHKFGYQSAIGTTAIEVTDVGEALAYPSSAGSIKVSSSSANDDAAGTGARTVQLYGLDGSYYEVDETVTLDGQTEVNTSTSFLRVFRAIVRSAGSGDANAGTIWFGTGTVTAGVPATKYMAISPGENQTLHCAWTVPANRKLWLQNLQLSTTTAAKVVTARLVARPEGEVWQTKDKFLAYNDGGLYQFQYTPGVQVFTEKTDVAITAAVDAGTTDVAAAFGGNLVRG